MKECASLDLFVDTNSTAYNSTNTVTVTNPEPATCTTTATSVKILVVASPEITSATPAISCLQSDLSLTLTGTGFYVIDYVKPTVTVNGVSRTVTTTTGCTTLLTGKHRVQTCTSLKVTIPQNTSIKAPQQPVVALCPSDLSDCCEENVGAITFVPPPTITGASPSEICAANNPQAASLYGTFLAMSTTSPTLKVSGVSTSVTLSSCTNSTVGSYTAKSCTELKFNVPSSASYGSLLFSVDDFCSASSQTLMTNVPTPTLTSVTPPNVCVNAKTAISIRGSNFLRYNSEAPLLSIGDSELTVGAMSSCTTVTTGFELCTLMNASITKNSLPLGILTVTVENGVTVSCAGSRDIIEVVPSPEIYSVTPQYCENEGGYIIINGTDFSATWAEITFQNQDTLLEYSPSEILDISSTAIETYWDASYVPAGEYKILVTNAESCTATFSGSISVNKNVLSLWYLDPPVALNSLTTTVTLFTTGLDAQVEEVVFSGPEILSFSNVTGTFNEFSLSIPVNTAPGQYTVTILSPNTCHAVSQFEFTVINQTEVTTLKSVEPSIIATLSDGSVTITAQSAVFQESILPDVYIFLPSCNGCTPIELSYVSFSSTTCIDVVIPSGIEPDVYTILVVQADGVALSLEESLTIVDFSLPTISSVYPEVITPDELEVTITGTFQENSNFSLSLICYQYTILYTDNTVTFSNSTTVIATLSDNPSAGTSCVILLSNSVDGTSCSYSSVAYQVVTYFMFAYYFSLIQDIY